MVVGRLGAEKSRNRIRPLPGFFCPNKALDRVEWHGTREGAGRFSERISECFRNRPCGSQREPGETAVSKAGSSPDGRFQRAVNGPDPTLHRSPWFAATLLALAASVGAEQVSVRPRSIDLGNVAVGVRVESQITLINNADEAIEVSLSASEPLTLPVESLTLEGGSEREIEIAFTAWKPGPFQSEVAVEVKKLFGSDGLSVPVTATAARPGLLVDPPEIEFDSVAVGATARRVLLLNNNGPVPLQIDSIYLAGGTGPFAILLPDRLSLEPGASGEVTLEFTPPGDGRLVDRLILTATEVRDRVEVAVGGVGLAAAAVVSPLPEVGLDFGRSETGQRSSATVTVLNHGRAPLEISGIELSGEGFSVSSAGNTLTLEPDGRGGIEVDYHPTFPGVSTGTLSLATSDPERPRISFPLKGTAFVGPPEIVVVGERAVDMGRVAVGKTSRQPLLIWNRGGSPFAVATEVKGEGEEFEVENSSYLLQPGESASVGLSFRPQTTGFRKALLEIGTEKGPTVLPLTGTGRYLELSPTTAEFGRVPVGEASNAVIDLTNVGNADFTVTRVLSTSPDFTVHTQVSADGEYGLPANSLRSLPVKVTFTPTLRGPRSGTLRLEGFWEEGSEAFDILLSGTGIAAEIELHPSGPVDFGYVFVGDTGTRTLVATNIGDTALRVAASTLSREAFLEPASFSLQPGESTRLQLSFSPRSLGDRFAQILLVSNDVRDKAQPVKLKGHGALPSIDLTQVSGVTASRGSRSRSLSVPWTGNPLVVIDGTRIDLTFAVPDSLKAALVGRKMEVEWVELDEGYGPVGPSKRLEVNIYDDDLNLVPADALNLRLEEAGMKRVRLKITTRSHPGAAPQGISQVFEVGGWKWEFEAKPLVSFLTIRPGRDYTDADGNKVEGETQRLIGLPGIAFAGWHNPDNASVSGIHLTAIGNVLEALSTDNAIAVTLGIALSAYKDRLLFGFGWDIYDSRPAVKQKGTQDYIMTIKYSGLF